MTPQQQAVEMARDPRKDPRPGDVLLFPYEGTPGEKQQVLSSNCNGVSAQPINFIAGEWQVMWGPEEYTDDEWDQLASSAEVLYVAPPAESRAGKEEV